MDKFATMVEDIKTVLRIYYKYDDSGKKSELHSPYIDADTALEEIHKIVGKI